MWVQISAGRVAGPVCKCTGQCTLEESVQGGGVCTGDAKFF